MNALYFKRTILLFTNILLKIDILLTLLFVQSKLVQFESMSTLNYSCVLVYYLSQDYFIM